MKRYDKALSVNGIAIAEPPATAHSGQTPQHVSCASDLYPEYFADIQEEIANAIELSGIVLDGTDRTQLFQAIQAGGGLSTGGTLLLASGNFVVPAGVTKLKITVCGGGGGGAGSSGNGGAPFGGRAGTGAGGGAGGVAVKVVTVTPAQVIPFTIGAGGAPGTGSALGVGNGGSPGGFSTMLGVTGSGADGGAAVLSGGSGATGSGGDYQITGKSASSVHQTQNLTDSPDTIQRSEEAVSGFVNFGFGGRSSSGGNFQGWAGGGGAGGAGAILVEF